MAQDQNYLHLRGGRNGRWRSTTMLMMLALLLSSLWPPHLTSLSLTFLIYKLKITLIPTSLVVIEIRKEIRIVGSFVLCLAHHKCPVKIRREKITGSRYPLYLDITCFRRLVFNSSSPLVDISEMVINGHKDCLERPFYADLSRHYLGGGKKKLKLGSSITFEEYRWVVILRIIVIMIIIILKQRK